MRHTLAAEAFWRLQARLSAAAVRDVQGRALIEEAKQMTLAALVEAGIEKTATGVRFHEATHEVEVEEGGQRATDT